MVTALGHMTGRGFISREKGNWKLKCALEEIDLEVPENLRQMIEIQIERSSEEEHRALEVASVTWGFVLHGGQRCRSEHESGEL
jgi:hypothetical protein